MCVVALETKTKMKCAVFLAMVATCLVGSGSCANILAIFPIPSKGHKNAMVPIAETLAARGHKITLVSPYPLPNKVENIDDVVISELADLLGPDDINWFEMQKEGMKKKLQMSSIMQDMMKKMYSAVINNQKVRAILERKNPVDLLFFDALGCDFGYIISDHLQVPFVTQSSGHEPPYNVLLAMGGSMEYASIPSIVTDIEDPRRMNFFQRLINVVSTEALIISHRLMFTSMVQDLAEKDFPNSRPIAEIIKDTSIIFINRHPATAVMRPLPPTVVSIGPSHTRPANPLSEVRNQNLE